MPEKAKVPNSSANPLSHADAIRIGLQVIRHSLWHPNPILTDGMLDMNDIRDDD